MCDVDPSAYAEERVPEVLDQPGVERATWWENVAPGRADLPRRLPEFTLLGGFEVGAESAAPVAPDAVTGRASRPYPRPGQGRVTGRAPVGLSLVLISPRSGD